MISENNPAALNYFSFDEGTGMIYYATYKEEVVTKDNGNGETKEEPGVTYILSPNSMSYKSVTNMCSMPYTFLFNLLQVSKNPEYVMAVVDLLLENSDVEFMIQDQMSISTQTHVETYHYAAKTVKKEYEEEETTHQEQDEFGATIEVPSTEWKFSGSSTSYDYPAGQAEINRIITTTYENTATAFVQKANTWCMDFVQGATANDTNTPGEEIVVNEEYDKEYLSGLNYSNLISSDNDTSGSTKTDTYIYSSDTKPLFSTSEKLDMESHNWTISEVTEKRVNYEKFLGLWRNDTGVYYTGGEYKKDGKLVRI